LPDFQIAANDAVFIYDILALGDWAFMDGLRSILESEQIWKVGDIHGFMISRFYCPR